MRQSEEKIVSSNKNEDIKCNSLETCWESVGRLHFSEVLLFESGAFMQSLVGFTLTD